MQNDETILKDLFSSAFADEVSYEGHEDDFLFINKKLTTSSFYKFSLTRFNLYYALGILSSVLITSIVGIDFFFFQKKKEKQLEAKILALKDQIEVKSASYLIVDSVAGRSLIKEDLKQADQKDLSREIRNPIVKTNIQKNQGLISQSDNEPNKLSESPSYEVKKMEERIVADSTYTNNNKQDQVLESKVKVKTVKIIKQDTIIRYDSIKLKPRIPFFRK